MEKLRSRYSHVNRGRKDISCLLCFPLSRAVRLPVCVFKGLAERSLEGQPCSCGSPLRPFLSLTLLHPHTVARGGNSESDIMLTTTCIACITFINYFPAVSTISARFSSFSGKAHSTSEATLFSCAPSTVLPSTNLGAGLQQNTVSTLLCEQFNCISFGEKKPKLGLGEGNVSKHKHFSPFLRQTDE